MLLGSMLFILLFFFLNEEVSICSEYRESVWIVIWLFLFISFWKGLGVPEVDFNR